MSTIFSRPKYINHDVKFSSLATTTTEPTTELPTTTPEPTVPKDEIIVKEGHVKPATAKDAATTPALSASIGLTILLILLH